jgi:cysteinyl-tRNA synthetase
VSHHYRSPVDFDVQVVDGVARFFSLEAADRSLSGFYTTLQRIDQFVGDNDGGEGAVLPEAEKLVPDAKAALAEDFNAPEVMAAMHAAGRLANKLLDEGKGIDKAVRRRTLARLGKDLRAVGGAIGVLTQEPAAYLRERRERLVKAKKIDVAAVEAKLAERKAARAEKNFARADEIRKELAAMGVELLDTPAGTDWRIADAD